MTELRRNAPEDWRILLGLALYRTLLVSLLVAVDQSGYSQMVFADVQGVRYRWGSIAYTIAALGLILLVIYRTPRLEIQAHVHFAVDVVAVAGLMYATGGVTAGFGVLLILPALGCGLLLRPRMAVVQASGATLAMFGEEILRQSGAGFDPSEFTRAGLLGITFFATSTVGAYISSRARRSEQLAEKMGSEFADLSRLNERIIETLYTGVVVVDAERRVRTVNHAALRLLGIKNPEGELLAKAAPSLHIALEEWLAGDLRENHPIVLNPHSPEILPAFSRLGFAAQTPILILLDDASELRAQAQQMKLASLGRLSASIAHEIRNPLSAITHAGQLIAESPEIGAENQRLLDMIRRHGARIDKIVRDVLELSRRDAVMRETLTLREWLLRAIALYEEGRSNPLRRIELLDVPPELRIRFAPSHLQQVLFNLWDNSFEHSANGQEILVLLHAGADPSGQIFLETADNGPGIPEELRERIFEPFFTTSARGTGLGLYLARELCEYNQARLSIRDAESGACLRISFARDTAFETPPETPADAV